MRISKFLLMVCAATLCASFIPVRAQDNPAQAAARAALLEKMGEAAAPQAPTNTETAPPVVVTPSGATVEQPAQPTNVPAMTAPPAVPPPIETPEPATTMPSTNDVTAPAPAQPSATEPPAPTVAPEVVPATNAVPVQMQPPTPALEVKPVVTEPAQPPKISTTKEPGLQPVETPALPISTDKQAQLQALLEKYKADQITPAEYQTERAKILGGP